MFLLYFLDIYMNLVKYLLRVPLDVSINQRHLHQDAGKTYRKWDHAGSIFQSNHLQAYEKEYWRLSAYERIIREDYQNCLFDKREISYDKSSACEKRWETFLLKRVMVKAGIQTSISEEPVRKFLQKTNLKWTSFQRKGILTKNSPQIET